MNDTKPKKGIITKGNYDTAYKKLLSDEVQEEFDKVSISLSILFKKIDEVDTYLTARQEDEEYRELKDRKAKASEKRKREENIIAEYNKLMLEKKEGKR